MKNTYISLLVIAFSANASVIEYQIEKDNVVDGLITYANNMDLKVSYQQGAFSGYDDASVIRGEFSNNESVIRFDKTTNDAVSYYIGVKSEDGYYKGNWYDTNGNGGDFRLLSSSVEKEGCSGVDQTGWHNGQYCNADIDGGGWQLVAIRKGANQGTGVAVDKITTTDSSQYLKSEEWNSLKDKSKEILFVQPNTGVWGTMNISAASVADLCVQLSNDLGSSVLVHAEDNGCDGSGLDYTAVGHSRERGYQGNLYFHSKKYKLWNVDNRTDTKEYIYSDQLMVYVR